MGLGKIVNEITRRTPVVGSIRAYTVIVERYVKPPMKKVYMDQRKVNLKPVHYHYKLVDVLHKKKWGNVDLMLTEYVEGVGHKGEIVNVPRHLAYYELLPSRLAVYPTDEYLEMFKKDRAEIVNKPKVSPYAMKAKEEIEKITLDVPMNLNAEWQLTVENIRIALRYNVITLYFLCFINKKRHHTRTYF